MIEILKLMLGQDSEDKFDQDLCLNFDMNSTLGSVVPLAMFYKKMMNQNAITRRVIVNSKQGHVKVDFNNKDVNKNIIMEKATLISGGLQKPRPNITTLG